MDVAEIVIRLAKIFPLYYVSSGERYCFFCQALQENEVDAKHADDCIWVAARELQPPAVNW
jgi:hypothetical protein